MTQPDRQKHTGVFSTASWLEAEGMTANWFGARTALQDRGLDFLEVTRLRSGETRVVDLPNLSVMGRSILDCSISGLSWIWKNPSIGPEEV